MGKRLWMPSTSVLVTLLVAILSILVGPAVARQWEDRQKARELQAGLADQIATSTARAIAAGAEVARAQQTQAQRQRIGDARASWQSASLRIEMKLRAYFPAAMAQQWEQFADDIDTFLLEVCAYASPAAGFARDARSVSIAGILEYLAGRQPPGIERLPDRRQTAESATGDRPEARALAVGQVGDWMSGTSDKMTARVLAAHPAGFITNRRDLVRELLP